MHLYIYIYIYIYTFPVLQFDAYLDNIIFFINLCILCKNVDFFLIVTESGN